MENYFEVQKKVSKDGNDTISSESIKVEWTHFNKNDLNISHAVILTQKQCNDFFDRLESELEYFTGDLARVKVFGKCYDIPRQQSAYGEPGITYRYSGTTVPAKTWSPSLAVIRDMVEKHSGVRYNFVLVNKYRNGNDKMGDHKDDEKELDKNTPIASLTLGAERDFIFKHQDRKTNQVCSCRKF